jgi:thiol:disulfide interchange protein DsbC
VDIYQQILRLIGVAVATCLLGAGVATAGDDAAATILRKLGEARPDLKFGDPRPSALPGLYEVQVHGGPLIYVNADGSHFVAGDLFAVQQGGFVNLAEQVRQKERADLVATVRPEDMIIFAPQNPKATITVFTDVDCGYCRKLHREIAEFNERGIAVHYLAFPRAGLGSPSYRKIASAWCAADRKDALTKLKKGEDIPENVCADNPVAAQILLGDKVGVTGTPAIVLQDGTLVPGYRPPKDMAALLGIE